MVRVVEVESAYAADVGADGNLIVGDALCCPYATDLLRSFAKDFEDPPLVLVGNGEAFAAVAVAVLLDEAAHEAYGFASCGAALQGDALQFLNHEESLLVL